MLAAIAAVIAAAGCASVPIASGSSVAGGALNAQADRLVLVTIANPGGPMRSQVGSTPHGYERVGAYSEGDQAHATAAALARAYDLKEVREWPIAALRVQCLVFALPPQADRDAVLRQLALDQRVRLAQSMQVFGSLGLQTAALDAKAAPSPQQLATVSYNDPYFELQSGFAAIEAGAAQQWSRGEGVDVAIIDTGVDIRHPDLAGRIGTTRNFIDDDQKSFEIDRHGTEVAGIIAAVANNGLGIVGVAPAARLQIYKACQPQQPLRLEAWCNSFTLALALSAAIESHAQIVNLSLGGPADPLLTQLVSHGQRLGMIFVGAVPADGRLDGFPLNIAGVIAAQQSDRPDPDAGVLHAPGRQILSLTPGGHYDFATGSSFAAAHVTGAIALLRSRLPGLDAAAMLALLGRTTSRDAEGQTIDVCAALAAMLARVDCAHQETAVATATDPP